MGPTKRKKLLNGKVLDVQNVATTSGRASWFITAEYQLCADVSSAKRKTLNIRSVKAGPVPVNDPEENVAATATTALPSVATTTVAAPAAAAASATQAAATAPSPSATTATAPAAPAAPAAAATDPRRVIGAKVHALAWHVTAESECARRYGANKKEETVEW